MTDYTRIADEKPSHRVKLEIKFSHGMVVTGYILPPNPFNPLRWMYRFIDRNATCPIHPNDEWRLLEKD